MFSAVHKIPACDRQTDEQTDRRTDILRQHTPRYTRRTVKNWKSGRVHVVEMHAHVYVGLIKQQRDKINRWGSSVYLMSHLNTIKDQHSMLSATFNDIKSTSWLVQTQTTWLLYSTVNRQSQLLYTARWSVDWQDSVVLLISDKNVVVLGHSEACWIVHLWLSIDVYDSSIYSNYTDHTWRRELTDHILTSGQLDRMPCVGHTWLQIYFSHKKSVRCVFL